MLDEEPVWTSSVQNSGMESEGENSEGSQPVEGETEGESLVSSLFSESFLEVGTYSSTFLTRGFLAFTLSPKTFWFKPKLSKNIPTYLDTLRVGGRPIKTHEGVPNIIRIII
jgi:hypothetical protein